MQAESKAFKKRPLTCWPVLTEAAWLFRNRKQSLERLFANLEAGIFEIAELPPASGRWLATFLGRYHDIGAQLADAALMYLAETRELDTVFTLDRRDFSIYRTADGRALRVPSA